MKQLILITALLSPLSFCFGQRSFSIDNGSTQYSAAIAVKKCEGSTCEGKGTIKLTSKKTNLLFQTLTSADLYFSLDDTQKPKSNIINESPLVFDDFNFDGQEDLAIRNGNHSGYGGPSYDVYVFNKTRNRFVISTELTKLATENLGMFETDKKRKRLITSGKSGCCWHVTTEYDVVPQKGLRKVVEVTEDAQSGDHVIVTTKVLANGKWTTKVKKQKPEGN